MITDFNQLESNLEQFIKNLDKERNKYNELIFWLSKLKHDFNVFKDFFKNYSLKNCNIEINDYEGLDKSFEKLEKKTSEMKKDLETCTDNQIFIERCEKSINYLKEIEQNFNDLFEKVKKKVSKFMKPFIKNKEMYLKTLKKLANIKFEGDDKSKFISNLDGISQDIDDSLVYIEEFLTIQHNFSSWKFDDQVRDIDEVDYIFVERGQYNLTKIENSSDEYIQHLEKLKNILLENCGKYGEFYIELNKFLEEESLKEFVISDIENEENFEKYMKELGVENLFTIIQNLSKFGLIRTKYTIE